MIFGLFDLSWVDPPWCKNEFLLLLYQLGPSRLVLYQRPSTQVIFFGFTEVDYENCGAVIS